MKITCNVEVFNRVLTSLNLRRRGKFTVATVALCKKANKGGDNEKDAFLIVCTSQNPCGTKYKVYNNIENVFNKFMNEGKATIRIKEPAHDIIMSKADPLQLRTFLHAVGLTLIGQGKGQVQLSFPPTKVEQPVQQKMIIQKRKDYLNKANFPPSLVFLRVHNCKLAKIERRILELGNLQILDFSNNSIRELPVALAELRLKELILSDNQIEWFPPELSVGPLGQNLQVLDLSKNSITKLSIYFCSMKNLRVLSLKCNHISVIPRNIACLESLRMFSASHNHIKLLPFGMRKLQLDTLDLFHNPLDADVVLRPETLWTVPSLLEWAASSVVKNKIPYGPHDLPKHLIDFIIQRCPCPCGRQVFQRTSFCILVLDLYKLASTVVYINNTSRFKVPLQVYFCSTKCWKNDLQMKEMLPNS